MIDPGIASKVKRFIDSNQLPKESDIFLFVPTEWISTEEGLPERNIDDDSVKVLAEDILERGLIHPVTLYVEGSKIHCLDGSHRLAAHRYLASTPDKRHMEYQTIASVIKSKKASEQEIQDLRFVANEKNKANGILTTAFWVKSKIDKGATSDEIAKIALGRLDRPWVSAWKKVADWPPETIDIIRKNEPYLQKSWFQSLGKKKNHQLFNSQ